MRLLRGILPVCCATWLLADPFSGSILEDHSSRPVRGARVQVRVAGAPRMTADLESGADGTFRAAVDLPPGDYRVDISKPNFADVTLSLHLPLDRPLAVRLIRFGAISGRITDAQNQPLGGGAVQAMIPLPNGQFRAISIGPATQADDTGRYRLYNLPPGRYAVAVSWATMNRNATVAGTYLFPSNQRPEVFTIASGTTIDGIDFVVPPQSDYSVSGRINSPFPDKASAVTLVLRDRPSLAASMLRTEADGTFRFDRMAPGAYEMMVAAPATGYAGFGAVLAPEPVFTRTAVDIGGQPVTGINVTPEAGLTVRLSLHSEPGCPNTATVLLDPIENWGALLFKTVELTTARELVVRHLAPGPYRIYVTKPDEGCFGAEVPTTDFRAVQSVGIRIVPAGNVQGRVEPLSPNTPTVTLTSLNTQQPVAVHTIPDADGRFRFSQVRPGAYRIAAGAASQEITVHSNQGTAVALQLPENRP